MENSNAVADARSEHWGRMCVNLRVRVKDRLTHRPLFDHWPACLRVDAMSRDALLALQSQRLTALVNDVVQHVPFYQQWARASGYQPGDSLNPADLPIVTKDDYRADMEQFQSRRVSPDTMRVVKTSGSSGEPFRLRRSPDASNYSYACLWRSLSRWGLRPGQRRILLWGQGWTYTTTGWHRPVRRLRLAVRNWMNNTQYINAYDLTHRNVAQAVDLIERFQPTYMHGYCSGLYAIAAHLRERGRGLQGVTLTAVATESEKLYDFQRQAMAEVFGCPVIENYGCVELGNIAAQEPAGTMYINDDLYKVEQDADGGAVITNLLETGFPFIRYRLGDLIELAPPVDGGLPYSRLLRVIGRTVDMIPVPAGGYIHGVSLAHVIDPHLAKVRRYQVHQVALDRFVVRLVLRAPLDKTEEQKIIADLRQTVGSPVAVEIEIVDDIAPAASGKFRWVVSDVSALANQTIDAQQRALAT